MGYGLKRKFEIIDWYTDLAGDASRILRDLMDGFDDDTWDAWDYKRNRQNYIGAHVWVSKSKVASRIRKGRSSVSRSFKEMENKGWITQAHNVKALENNRTYVANAPTISGEPPKHYVFNISKMCRVLNVVATVEHFGLKFDSDDADVLLECAWTDYPDDYENPTYRSVEDFEDLVILNYEDLIKYGPPDRWEDLYEPKKESAWAGAGTKVETSKAELSTFDYTTLEQKFAKQQQRYDKYSNLAYELPLRLAFTDPEDQSTRLELNLGVEHINDDGYLDPTRLKGNPGVKALKQRSAVLQNEVEKQRLQRGDDEIEVNTFMANWEDDDQDEVEQARRLLESFNRRFSDVLLEEAHHALR